MTGNPLVSDRTCRYCGKKLRFEATRHYERFAGPYVNVPQFEQPGYRGNGVFCQEGGTAR